MEAINLAKLLKRLKILYGFLTKTKKLGILVCILFSGFLLFLLLFLFTNDCLNKNLIGN
jgi:hypothetical protein